MNRLPKVLQNEIWEYVHGDRAYWKAQHMKTMEELEQNIEFVEDATYDGFRPPMQSKTSGIVAGAKSRLNWRIESFPVLSWRRFLSRHNYPMHCDSLADYKIHVHAFSEFRS